MMDQLQQSPLHHQLSCHSDVDVERAIRHSIDKAIHFCSSGEFTFAKNYLNTVDFLAPDNYQLKYELFKICKSDTRNDQENLTYAVERFIDLFNDVSLHEPSSSTLPTSQSFTPASTVAPSSKGSKSKAAQNKQQAAAAAAFAANLKRFAHVKAQFLYEMSCILISLKSKWAKLTLDINDDDDDQLIEQGAKYENNNAHWRIKYFGEAHTDELPGNRLQWYRTLFKLLPPVEQIGFIRKFIKFHHLPSNEDDRLRIDLQLYLTKQYVPRLRCMMMNIENEKHITVTNNNKTEIIDSLIAVNHIEQIVTQLIERMHALEVRSGKSLLQSRMYRCLRSANLLPTWLRLIGPNNNDAQRPAISNFNTESEVLGHAQLQRLRFFAATKYSLDELVSSGSSNDQSHKSLVDICSVLKGLINLLRLMQPVKKDIKKKSTSQTQPAPPKGLKTEKDTKNVEMFNSGEIHDCQLAWWQYIEDLLDRILINGQGDGDDQDTKSAQTTATVSATSTSATICGSILTATTTNASTNNILNQSRHHSRRYDLTTLERKFEPIINHMVANMTGNVGNQSILDYTRKGNEESNNNQQQHESIEIIDKWKTEIFDTKFWPGSYEVAVLFVIAFVIYHQTSYIEYDSSNDSGNGGRGDVSTTSIGGSGDTQQQYPVVLLERMYCAGAESKSTCSAHKKRKFDHLPVLWANSLVSAECLYILMRMIQALKTKSFFFLFISYLNLDQHPSFIKLKLDFHLYDSNYIKLLNTYAEHPSGFESKLKSKKKVSTLLTASQTKGRKKSTRSSTAAAALAAAAAADNELAEAIQEEWRNKFGDCRYLTQQAVAQYKLSESPALAAIIRKLLEILPDHGDDDAENMEENATIYGPKDERPLLLYTDPWKQLPFSKSSSSGDTTVKTDLDDDTTDSKSTSINIGENTTTTTRQLLRLPMTPLNILAFTIDCCVALLLDQLEKPTHPYDLTVGHLMVCCQYAWPYYYKLFSHILATIIHKRCKETSSTKLPAHQRQTSTTDGTPSSLSTIGTRSHTTSTIITNTTTTDDLGVVDLSVKPSKFVYPYFARYCILLDLVTEVHVYVKKQPKLRWYLAEMDANAVTTTGTLKTNGGNCGGKGGKSSNRNRNCTTTIATMVTTNNTTTEVETSLEFFNEHIIKRCRTHVPECMFIEFLHQHMNDYLCALVKDSDADEMIIDVEDDN